MRKGTIILVPFPFTDLSGIKNRPAVILFCSEWDVTVSFITSQSKWNKEENDLFLLPDSANGLKVNSHVRTSKIVTLSKELILGELGILNSVQIDELNFKLKRLFQL